MPRTVQPAQPEPGLWFCNWRLWVGARELLSAALAPLHIGPREFWLLALAAKGVASQHELADSCGMDPSSMVALLDELETRGWVQRQRNPRDRRQHLITLTSAGTELFAQAAPLAQRAETDQLRALPPIERRRLLALLRKLVNA